MKFIFRGILVFTYNKQNKDIVAHMSSSELIPSFNECVFTIEDCKLLSQFFDAIARHRNGEDVELKDISVF